MKNWRLWLFSLVWFEFDFFSDLSVDFLCLLKLIFIDVEKYVVSFMGCESIVKVYKYFVELGYFYNIKGKCMVNKFGISIWKVFWKLLIFLFFMLRKYWWFVFLEFVKFGNFCIYMKNVWYWFLIWFGFMYLCIYIKLNFIFLSSFIV